MNVALLVDHFVFAVQCCTTTLTELDLVSGIDLVVVLLPQPIVIVMRKYTLSSVIGQQDTHTQKNTREKGLAK